MKKLMAGVGCCVTLALAGCSSGADSSVADLTSGDTGPARVVYLVTGSAREVSLTVSTPTGMSQQDAGVPLRNEGGSEGLVFDFPRGKRVYIAARNKSDVGEVTCQITVDGVPIAENTSTAGYGVATCSGNA